MKEIEKTEYFFNGAQCIDGENRIFVSLSIDSLLEKFIAGPKLEFCQTNDFAFYGSGWQGWAFGGEIDEGKFQKSYFPLVPQWNNYFTVPGRLPKSLMSKKLLRGSFFIYLRWNINGKNLYLAVCSTGNVREVLPPVNFYVDRKKRSITCTAYSDGKIWTDGEKIAELAFFTSSDFFELKKSVQSLFAQDKENRFGRLDFLNSSGRKDKIIIGGWESWYNHYANINGSLIKNDLESLSHTENLIKTHFLNSKKPCVFQIDDGWEMALGDWEARPDRFPGGMTALAQSISWNGYIPGLWIAPFIVDLRSELAKAHPEWILRDKKGKPLAAGFNPLWGANFGKEQPSFPGSYFCLDLSQEEVLDYLDNLIEKAVNVWGFRYLKLDFLFAGLLNGAFKNGGAAYIWYYRAVKVLTKRSENSKGEKIAYLGCGMPFESSFNAFPLSRIGTDTKEAWDIAWMKKANYPARPSAFVNMQDTLGHAFWNQAIFINDPDVVFLRYENISLNDKEKILIALVNFLFASQIMHSDDPVHFDTEREGALTKKIEGLYSLFENEEFGVENRDSVSYFIFSKNGKYTGFINLGDKPVYIDRFELTSRFSEKTENLEAVIEYGQRNAEVFLFESHSISIYERK